jgi:hypothetical protein
MIKTPMSVAAAGLLRAFLARAKISHDRILLTDFRSTEWQSLTFVGERHQFHFRIAGPNSSEVVRNLVSGLEDAEFSIPGHVVADIAVAAQPEVNQDGSVSVGLEALTIAE